MSLLTEPTDYNNGFLTWKLSSKKGIDFKSYSPVSIVNTTEQNNVEAQYNNFHTQESIMTKEFRHNPTIQEHDGPGMIISHIHNNLNGTVQMQQFKSNENVDIEPDITNSSENFLHIQTDQQSVKNNYKEKTLIVKKVKKFPVDGIAYHSKQLGLKVPPKKSLGIKGKIIDKQTREVIHNVFKFMKDEARNGTKIPLANYRERVLAATGISKCTYSKITSKEYGVLMEAFIPTKKIGKDIKVNESSMDHSVNENTSIYRPKINRDASTRDDVYNLEDLVPSYILSTLKNEALNIIKTGDVSQFGGFVSSNMAAILRSDSSQEITIKKLTIFLYIEFLLKFINTPMKNVTRKFVVCDKSIEVNNHILNTFSVNSPSGRTRPVHMKDKSLCFILILTAKAMDYEVDLTNLAKDCKIGVKKALEISRILAFNSSPKNKNIVTLKLPLPTPVLQTPRKRK